MNPGTPPALLTLEHVIQGITEIFRQSIGLEAEWNNCYVQTSTLNQRPPDQAIQHLHQANQPPD